MLNVLDTRSFNVPLPLLDGGIQNLYCFIKGNLQKNFFVIFHNWPLKRFPIITSQTQGFYPKIPLFVQTQLLSLFIKPNAAFPLESSSSAAANGDGNSKSEVQSNTSEYIRIQHQSDTILTKWIRAQNLGR